MTMNRIMKRSDQLQYKIFIVSANILTKHIVKYKSVLNNVYNIVKYKNVLSTIQHKIFIVFVVFLYKNSSYKYPEETIRFSKHG